MQTTTIRDEYLVPDPATFWREVFFSTPVQERLYRDMGCFSATVTKQDGSLERGLEREFVFEQPLEAPDALKKLFGDRQRLIEHGRFDPAQGVYHFDVVPDGALGRKVELGGTVRVEPRDGGKIERIVELHSNVHVFGLAALAERYVIRQTADIYKKRTALEREVVQRKGLSVPPPAPAPASPT